MSKSIQLKTNNNEYVYPHPYYPIGSIYLSVNNVNPSKWFGGKWEQIAKGKTLIGVDPNDNDFNSVKKTGGEKSHSLNINEMPSHNHKADARVMVWDAGKNAAAQPTYNGVIQYYGFNEFQTESTGGGQAHNNMPPYFTCYIWLRTA